MEHELNILKFDFPAGNRLPLVMMPAQSKYREFVNETGGMHTLMV